MLDLPKMSWRVDLLYNLCDLPETNTGLTFMFRSRRKLLLPPYSLSFIASFLLSRFEMRQRSFRDLRGPVQGGSVAKNQENHKYLTQWIRGRIILPREEELIIGLHTLRAYPKTNKIISQKEKKPNLCLKRPNHKNRR